MKKIFLVLIILLNIIVSSQTLKGGVSQDYIPKGFFGSWGVISKMTSTNNPTLFNYESRDIWMLSGYSNILILENLESGARSEITIEEKSIEGRTLKFVKRKTTKESQGYSIYIETVEFILSGNNFSGTDKFEIQRYDEKNKLKKTDIALYQVEGVKIAGG